VKFKSYPKYKASGIEWLGDVPSHWSVASIKHGFKIVGGSTPKSEQSEFWDGEIIWVTPSDLSKLSSTGINDSQRKITAEGLASCGTTLVPAGSIVLSTRAPIGSLAVAETELCTNQGCKSLVPKSNSESLFYSHLLSISTVELNVRGKGTTFLELSSDELGAFKVGAPPNSEQSAIATFLDRETAKIDTLIAKQEKLIDLLKEKRQAVISHAVTKGLDPTVPMKPSGVEWLGDVPEHWDVMPMKYTLQSIEQGWSPQCEGFPAGTDEWGVLKVGCVNGGIFRPEENKTLPLELDPIPKLAILAGDLLISRANTKELVGSAAVAKFDYPRLMLCDKLYRLRVDIQFAIPDFVSQLLGTSIARSQIEIEASGASASMLNIAQGTILELRIAFPPVSEQREIVNYLDRTTAKIDTLITKAQQAIALQKEHRTALISAAVTGKIDVRSENDMRKAA
jgi:type I restriction enzyme S subunit